MTNNEGKIKNFTDLNAWQRAHALMLEVYRETSIFPREEQFGLTSQLRRASISITSNIAEGFSRNSWKEKVQFYSMSLGSLTEIESQLIAARDLRYLPITKFESLTSHALIVNKLIHGLIKKGRSMIQST